MLIKNLTYSSFIKLSLACILLENMHKSYSQYAMRKKYQKV